MEALRQFAATQSQECALECGFRILEGESVVQLEGVGYAHVRDVMLTTQGKKTFAQPLAQAVRQVDPPVQDVHRGRQRDLVEYIMAHPYQWTGAMYIPNADRDQRYAWWEPRP